MEGKAIHNTCFNHMVDGWESFVHGGAHGAEDEQGCEIDISHQCPSQQAPMFVGPMNTAGDEEHEPIWPGQVHELVPPSVHHQSDIKACRAIDNDEASFSNRRIVGVDAIALV